MRTRPRTTLCLVLLAGAAVAAGSMSGVVARAAPQAVATDGPGALSHFDLARKDCLGTSRTAGSKVWYTVANGVLSDVYYPTVDNTNMETLQYIVTDGSTFTDLQTRDMTYTVATLDHAGMVCRVTATARSQRYRIVTDYVTDPGRNTLVMRTRFTPLIPGTYQLYARVDPTVNGNGGGGAGNGGADSASTDTSTGHSVLVSSDTNTITNAANRDYGQPVFMALDGPFSQVSSGFAGVASDGLIQLDASHRLTTTFDSALQGNVVQVGRLDLGRGNDEAVTTAGGDQNRGSTLTLALGFGRTQSEAVSAAGASRHADFDVIRSNYEEGWAEYDSELKRPPDSLPGIPAQRVAQLRDEYYLSANVVKASEDKTFPGAIAAGLASPWGQAVSAGDPNNTYFGSYREVFARDLYEAWTALFTDGDLSTARAAVNFLFNRQQQADGSMPRNSLLNGKTAPDSFGTQLDEAAYPILMADQMGMSSGGLYTAHIKPAADFIVAHGPAFGVERWEEQGGYSPSTIAAEIAGLIAAAHIADLNGDSLSARAWRGVADDFQRSIKGWTVTTSGPLAGHPYFIRLSKTGDPNAAISYNLGNGGPTLDQRSVIDAGFLELVRLGELPVTDADILQSLPVVDATIATTTSSGIGWHRYNGDGYGDGATDGHPWAPSGKGTGHLWPVLSGERGEQSLGAGDVASAATLLDAMANFSSGVGILPEQDWELPNLPPSPYATDPTIASIGFVNGKPAGSASPLTWSAAAYVRLMRDLGSGHVLEQPRATVNRYVTHTQGQTPLTVISPQDLSAINASPVTVIGATAPGNTVDVLAVNTDNNSSTTTASTTAGAGGTFSVNVPVTPGTTVLSVTATSPSGATAHAVRTVVWDFVPGTVMLDVTDPTGDDTGPGNYAYPTSADFHPGAFDITRFQVIDSGANVVFRLQTRDLSPTFGSPLGAQLVDVYVHDPAAAAADTTTQAAFASRNYQIAPAAAWSRLVEAQGFGQRFADAHGTVLGTLGIRANQISRFITVTVPKASLGQPGPGWTFTVVLTGQDGFSSDQARGFAPTPQPFAFGVCAAPSADPHCTVAPATVPKAIDVITPAGVLQSDELDYTIHNPVVIQGVTLP
jgi:glucoamylase